MGKNMIIRFSACVAVVALGAARASFGTTLTHRWSFNGDWTDSVGGSQSSATACGTYVSLYGGCDSAVFEIVDGRENEQR